MQPGRARGNGIDEGRLLRLAEAEKVVALFRDSYNIPLVHVRAEDTFLRAPHLRDMLLQLGVVAETFETAITWERFPDFHEAVAGAAAATTAARARIDRRIWFFLP